MKNQLVFSNFIWRFVERCGSQGLNVIVTIILARMLDPEAFGIIALVTVFTSLLQVFIEGGLGNALIQKKNADSLDFSTVFYFNITMCIVLYIGMYLAAPGIAKFYEMPELISVIRVLSLLLVISGIRNIQQAYVSKHLMFKKFFFATLSGTPLGAVIGIWMAYNGFGVWALVFQMLISQSVNTLVLWFTVKWRPKKMFSFNKLKSLFSYGWKLLVSSLIDTLYRDIRQLIIGKLYMATDLAYYNKAEEFPKLIVTNINTSIDSVLFPTMSAEQDDKERVKAMTRRAIKTSTYIMMPMMMGLAVCAEPIVSLLLTDKWLPCVPFLRIFCFTYAFMPIHTANLNAIKALGRSDLFLKLEVIKKIVGVAALLTTMWISVMAMAYSLLVINILGQIINAWPNRTLLNYKYEDQLRDMLPQIGLSIVMGSIVYCISFLGLDHLVTLVIQIPVGIAIYVLGSIIFKIDSYEYVKDILIGLFQKKKG